VLSPVDAPSVLAEARRLEEDGRYRDAIGTLTRANRAGRVAAIERALVRLRHEAFASTDHTPPSPLPPPIVAEPAGPTLAEIEPGELSVDALRRGLARSGCLLVRGLVPHDRVEAMVDGIDRALEAFDAGLAGAPVSDTEPWYAPFTPGPGQFRVGGRRNWVRASGGIWAADSPRMLFELLALVDDLGIGGLVSEHLGEQPALSANKCTLRRVPVDTNTDWHQDGAFLGTEVRTLNLWLSLSRCGVDAPGLDLVPRRLDDVVQTGTDGAIFDWAVSPVVVDQLAVDAPVLRPEFEPGDALLFDHLFLHRTAVSPGMTRERYAIETWFFAPSAYPDGQIPLVY
jgi:hypothetical protein